MTTPEYSSLFRSRLRLERQEVQDRFYAPFENHPPGIGALVLSDPETWSIPLAALISGLKANPLFLPSGGEQLFEIMMRFDPLNVKARAAVDTNLDSTLILAFCAYEPVSDTLTWLTIGSTSSD